MSVAAERNAGTSRAPRRRQYAHAPIVEAILGIQVEAPGLRPEALKAIHDEERTRYAKLSEAHAFEGSFQFEKGGEVTSTGTHAGLSGYVLLDETGRQAAQVNLLGFTYSKYEPYDRWEGFCDEARRLWEKYARIARITRVTRLGLRYVNRLDIPLPAGPIGEYLLTAPSVPAEVGGVMSGYAMELHLPQPDLVNTMTVVRQATVPPAREGVLSIVLDIETFRHSLDLQGGFDSIWDEVETLHSRENRTFEASITDKLRELFDR